MKSYLGAVQISTEVGFKLRTNERRSLSGSVGSASLSAQPEVWLRRGLCWEVQDLPPLLDSLLSFGNPIFLSGCHKA